MKLKRSKDKYVEAAKQFDSTSSTVAKAYDKMAANVITTNNTNYITASPIYGISTSVTLPEPVVKTEEQQQEEIAEIASTLENLIADFLPDADKQVPVDIAKAVVEYLYKNNKPLLPNVDSQLFMQAESTVAQRIQNMTMEEYAKVRGQLLGKHASI